MIKLGVNIDHVATLRQARHESFPDPVEAALWAIKGGADGITAHLREDRRHIQDWDMVRLKEKISVPLNMEMAACPSIVKVACHIRPEWTCIVPERREEVTTEGGLDVKRCMRSLDLAVGRLKSRGIKVSLFVGPTVANMRLSHQLGVDAVEIHTGRYARVFRTKQLQSELKKIIMAANEARRLGLVVNAGHGLDYGNVRTLVKKFDFYEFNIGFSIIARAVKVGMTQAVRQMKTEMRKTDCFSTIKALVPSPTL